MGYTIFNAFLWLFKVIHWPGQCERKESATFGPDNELISCSPTLPCHSERIEEFRPSCTQPYIVILNEVKDLKCQTEYQV